jgi:branched-chain amino acid transport system permease protein
MRRPFLFIVFGFLLLVPLLGEVFYTRLFCRIMIHAIFAMSLDVLLGYGGMVSFGHAVFFGAGAYTVSILSQHGMTDALILWPAAAGAAALLALPIGALSLRTSGAYFIMITLAFAQMVYYFASGLESCGGSDGMRMVSRNSLGGWGVLGSPAVFYQVVWVSLIAVFFGCRRLVHSRFGLVIGGIRQNESRMRSLGYAPFGAKLTCFVLAAAIAGFAGALIANETLYISPSFLHWTQSGHVLVMVILGGMGSLVGPILGAMALLLTEEVLSSFTEHWMIVLGPSLIAVVLYARRGLYSLLPGTGETRAGAP